MPKLSKAAVQEKIAEWVSLGKKVAKAEETMAAEIAPFVKKFEAATQIIHDHHGPRIAKLIDQRSKLQTEIIDWLKQQKKDVAVETDTAIAERKTGLAPRVIDVKKFLVVAKSKGEEMYKCISVGIALAEKLLGKKEVDKISNRPPATPTTQLRLK